MSHTIELRKVSKFYSTKDTVNTGFSRIDLNLDMGEFVVITGESGGGKSTLLNVISGLDTYEEGEMFVCGEDTTGYRTEDYERYRKTYIGNIFQDFNLVNSYTVYQNIELGMLLSGKKRRECKKRIKELIELVGLTEYTRTKASKLSGGQKQRVAIARALAKDAPIIVADEPTGNLDSESAVKIMETLSRISRNKLVVIVTHNYEQAEPYVTRKLTMHDGRIIEDKVIKRQLPDMPPLAEAPSEKRDDEAAEAPSEKRDDEAAEAPSEKRDDELVEAPSEKRDDEPVGAPSEKPADEPAVGGSGEFDYSTYSYYGSSGGEENRTGMKVGGRAARNAAREAAEQQNRGRRAAVYSSTPEPDKTAGAAAVKTAEDAASATVAAAKDAAAAKESKTAAAAAAKGIASKGKDKGVSSLGETDLGSIDPLKNKMGLWAQYRLGIRNTFNLPAKFILLLIVYLFVSTAVLAQYSSTKENLHQSGTLGYNMYFPNASIERMIVKKADKTALTDEDYEAIKKMPNVDYIVENDLGLDSDVSLESDNYDLTGPLYSTDTLDESRLTYGTLPKNDYEIVVELSDLSWMYEEIKEQKDEILGKEFYMVGNSEFMDYGTRVSDHKVKIVGIILKKADQEESDMFQMYGTGVRFYVSERLSGDVLRKMMAGASRTTINFSGTREVTPSGQVLYVASVLEPGEAYVLEDKAYAYYDEGNVAGKQIDIKIYNMYFSSEITGLTIPRLITPDNIEQYIGFKKEDYDMYSSYVFISQQDFDKLFRKGNFQMSVFMKDETASDETVQALEEAGYKVLPIKDTLTDIMGGNGYVIKLISVAAMAIAFVVLFVIAYLVIRLIMRSRNSYYSTLRILGANKRNTSRILRVELVLMMVIAYAVDMAVVYLSKAGYVDFRYLSSRLNFLSTRDYAVLFAVMLLMSLLIAFRYSRKLFKASAMKTYREEA